MCLTLQFHFFFLVLMLILLQKSNFVHVLAMTSIEADKSYPSLLLFLNMMLLRPLRKFLLRIKTFLLRLRTISYPDGFVILLLFHLMLEVDFSPEMKTVCLWGSLHLNVDLDQCVSIWDDAIQVGWVYLRNSIA